MFNREFGPGKSNGKTIPLAMFVGSYLPYSETFIYEQIRLQRRFNIRVMAYEELPFANQFPYGDKTVLNPIQSILYRAVGIAPDYDKSLNQFKPALIHAHFGTNGVLALPWAKKMGVPMAVTFHGHDIGGLMGINRLSFRYSRYNLFANQMFQLSDLIIAASSEIQTMLTERFHQPENKVKLIRLGIPLDHFEYIERPQRPAHIVMCGRFVKKKGFEYGISAFARAKSRFPGIHLTIVGTGALQKQYERIIASHRIQKDVTFTGVLRPDEMRSLFRRSDILLAPSLVTGRNDRESGILVVKEAGATGMPVIATRHGGIPEIIDHKITGYLCPEKNVDSLTHYLEKLLSSFTLRQSIGFQARKKIERNYDSRKQNAILEDALFEIVAKSPKPKQIESFSAHG